MVKVKVCGLVRPEDVAAAAEAGADMLGFVKEPSSPRCFADDPLPFRRHSIPLCAVFGLFFETPVTGYDFVQSMGESPGSNLPWIKSVPLGEGATVESLIEEVGFHFMVVLDTAAPTYGGTGRVVDWGLAAELVSALPQVKFFLAGGLGPDNVADAIRRVVPFGVDASSRLESSPGVKDHELVRRYVANAKGS